MYKVLFLTQWYPKPSSPISGIFIREHARAVSQFHDVTVLSIEGLHTQSRPPIKIERYEDDGIRTFRLSYSKPLIPKTSWFRRLSGTWVVIQEMEKAGLRPDIIQANIYSTADLAVILSSLLHRPAVLSENASTYPRNLFTRSQRLLVPYFMNRLRMIMPVSENLAGHIQRYGIKRPFRIVPNTVDITKFNPVISKQSKLDGIYQILFVGGLVKIKGISFLIKALSKLQYKNDNFRLIIVGDGPERYNLETLTDQLNLTSKVVFLGLKDKTEVADLMKQADFLVLPSLWETQAVVLLEAMATGLPVIASSVGGIPEIVKPECGLLVQPENVEDIAIKIDYMLSHIGNYSSLKISQYAQDKFSYHAVGQLFSDIYKKVIEEYR